MFVFCARKLKRYHFLSATDIRSTNFNTKLTQTCDLKKSLSLNIQEICSALIYYTCTHKYEFLKFNPHYRFLKFLSLNAPIFFVLRVAKNSFFVSKRNEVEVDNHSSKDINNFFYLKMEDLKVGQVCSNGSSLKTISTFNWILCVNNWPYILNGVKSNISIVLYQF